MCCGHGGEAAGMGFDCIQIPGAVTKTNGNIVTSNICGKSGLVTADGAIFVSICCK